MQGRKQGEEENVARELAVLEIRVDNIERIANESKQTAVAAIKLSRKHTCSQEDNLNNLKEAIAETRGALGKVSDANLKFVDELGRWKWFRMLIPPLFILIITTAAGAFASFVYVKNDVSNAKREQAATRTELKEVKNTQIRLLEAAQKNDTVADKSAKNVEEIKERISEIADGIKESKPKKRRR